MPAATDGSRTFRCKTVHVFADFWECQAAQAESCPHSLPLRNCYYCQHPECWSFAEC
jgi:hypothetical protein